MMIRAGCTGVQAGSLMKGFSSNFMRVNKNGAESNK